MKRHYFNLFFILLGVLFFSCGKQDKVENKRQKVLSYQKQISDLNTKIAILQRELEDDSIQMLNNLNLVPVLVKELSPERFEHFFQAGGTVEAIQEAFISPETGGRIKKILVREGQQVQQGTVLARLNTEIAESSIAEVKTQLDLASLVFRKQEELWKQRIGSEIEYLQAKNNKEALENRLRTLEAQLDMSILRAPISGVVDRIMQKEGELAAPGMMMLRLINMQELYINAEVPESYLPALSVGDKVEITFPTWPEMQVEAGVDLIGHAIEPQNRTFKVRVKLRNTPDYKLKPNMLSRLKFRDFEADDAFILPAICIKFDTRGAYVYRVKQDGEKQLAEKVYIQTGKVSEGLTLIRQGLEAGDKVIVEGYNMVTDGSPVRF